MRRVLTGDKGRPHPSVRPSVDEDPRGYLQETVPAPRRVLSVFEEWLARAYPKGHEYRAPARRLLGHVWHCQTRQKHKYGDGVPIDHRLIATMEETPHADHDTSVVWRPAEREELLEVQDYQYPARRSREFSLGSTFFEELLAAANEAGSARTRYDLVTGRRTSSTRQTSLTDRKQNSWKRRSRIIYATLKTLEDQRDVVNVEAVEAHLERRHRAFKEAKSDYYDAAEGAGHYDQEVRRKLWSLRRTYERKKSRYAQDRRLWNDIVPTLRAAEDQPAGIYEYPTAYEVQEISGRLTMTRGLQNASTKMKVAVRKGAAKEGAAGYRNYDIKSSQTEALIQELEDANEQGADLDRAVLTDYPGKDVLADRHGIPREEWKTIEHAVKFGARFRYDSVENARRSAEARVFQKRGGEESLRLENEIQTHETREMAIQRLVSSEVDVAVRVALDWEEAGHVESADAAYQLMKEIYGPMAQVIQRWRRWLISDYWEEESVPGGGGRYVENPCGIAIHLSPDQSTREQETFLATARLQGLEAAYMHAIARLAGEYDYEFLRNEHDGAVVLGKIPEEARERAREISGFRRAELEEKPFE